MQKIIMGSYSITIKFHGKIPIHLTWDNAKEEKTKFSPSKCRFHCSPWDKLPVQSESKILRAWFSSLACYLELRSLHAHTKLRRKRLNGRRNRNPYFSTKHKRTVINFSNSSHLHSCGDPTQLRFIPYKVVPGALWVVQKK